MKKVGCILTGLLCAGATTPRTPSTYQPASELLHIKEAQLGLFADRTSCHYFAANQFRLLLSSLAHVLVERLRALALTGTEFARLQASTLRTKLFKIGAVILRNTRRVRVLLSSAYPYQELFCRAALAVRSP